MATKKEAGLTKVVGDWFKNKITPKKLEKDSLMLFKCTECEGMHFRHAGYMEAIIPYVNASVEPSITCDSHQVKICVNCKQCFIWVNGQAYDVTDQIDLKAWEKTEKEADKCTGPGGEC